MTTPEVSPLVNGTPKELAWAEEIRSSLAPQITMAAAILERAIADRAAAPRGQDDDTIGRFAGVPTAIAARIIATIDARWWIDHRGENTSAILTDAATNAPLAPEWDGLTDDQRSNLARMLDQGTVYLHMVEPDDLPLILDNPEGRSLRLRSGKTLTDAILTWSAPWLRAQTVVEAGA